MSARLRCAIYTRKSTEEGLDQSFNSLDAQREACEAYILSQAGEGWQCLPDLYDDGGWSGGNMERPALHRLLTDIKQGRIDIVVVYKVDRLTRSLMDFARIVEVFDASKVSFVSVTQAFNTTSSMGRLTLNVLLSFAQFEREVTGERIRDKVAASKARGMWMGGNIPLGYDLADRQLVINPDEAALIRHIYARYLALKSLPALARDLTRAGFMTKRWTSRAGASHGGFPFNCSGLSLILHNRLYLGEIVHKGKTHAGMHDRIVDPGLFDAVQTQLAANHHQRTTRKARAAASPLTGKLFDADGQPMRPSFSYGRGKVMYRYYVSECLLPTATSVSTDNQSGIRLNAANIERQLLQALAPLLPSGAMPDILFEAINKAVVYQTDVHLALHVNTLANDHLDGEMLLKRTQNEVDNRATRVGPYLHLSVPLRPQRRGRQTGRQHIAHQLGAIDAGLAALLRMAHGKLEACDASPLAPARHSQMQAPTHAWIRKRLAFGLLAPDIQKAILQVMPLSTRAASDWIETDIPLDWEEQRALFHLIT
jgi:site-specific DNA recombinase